MMSINSLNRKKSELCEMQIAEIVVWLSFGEIPRSQARPQMERAGREWLTTNIRPPLLEPNSTRIDGEGGTITIRLARQPLGCR